MNKSELVDAIADGAGLSKGDAGKALDATLDAITSTLKGGGEIALTGFGKFSVADRAARMGVNPRTGEKVQIKASKAPKFSAGAALKNTVNGR